MAAKKKVKNIITTTTVNSKSEQSKASAKSLLQEIETNITYIQKQMTVLSQLRKTCVQLSNGNMKNYLQEPLNEKETGDLLIQLKTLLKGLNIKLSTTL